MRGIYCPVGSGAGEFEEGTGEDRKVADYEGNPFLQRKKEKWKRSTRWLSQTDRRERTQNDKEKGRKKDRTLPTSM
jgi:hypothetical protein